MNRDTPIKLYCKKVGQHLDCGRKEKTELLCGLCEEITEAGQQTADYSELVRKYGAPEETAATLQAALKEETVRQYQKKAQPQEPPVPRHRDPGNRASVCRISILG